MRRYLSIAILLLPGLILGAQEPQIDSLLAMSGLMASIPSNVAVRQSSSVSEGFSSLVAKNAESESFVGFRIKLFQSSAQSAREESERLVENFSEWYPSIPVYRSFSSPYFKVTVGNFRTRVDAEKTLRLFRSSFPTATIVKEKMKYPYLD